MKKFLIQFFIFSLPIICCWIIVFLVDPCNIYCYSKLIDNETKIKIINNTAERQPRGNLLWKTFEFKRKPFSNIIIGDSQSFNIKEELIFEHTGEKYYNFSIPGANFETLCSVFWFAAQQTKLKHVYLQLSFQNCIRHEKNFFYIAQDYMDKPYLYLFNSAALGDSFQNIKYKVTKRIKKGKHAYEFPISNDNKLAFKSYLKRTYKDSKYSDINIEELKQIVNYCNKNNITIEFLVLPAHQIYYDYLKSHDLIQMNEKFISEISCLAKTNNYSSNVKINTREENFIDYFHQKQFITDSITHLVWGNNQSLGLK